MKHIKKVLSLLLVLCMVFSLMPASVLAAGDGTASAGETGEDFYRIFHLDAGRKYFSPDEIKGIIDQLAANNYTHLELVFGNDGFRFLLNDMSVDVDGDGAADYSTDAVTSAVTNGNTSYSTSQTTDASILSEADMDAILSYAAEKEIGIIPLLNVPGHTNALNSAMYELGVTTTTGANMNLGSSEIAFAKALLQKYVTYFAAKGSTFFNIGADEYSNSGSYETYVSFVNGIAAMIKAAGMRPIAFNDCIQTGSGIDTNIVIAYWTASNVSATASELSAAGFDILNYNDSWYYVLGDALYDKWASGQWGYADSKAGLQTVKCTEVKGSSDVVPIGSCLPVWCDYPSYTYDAEKVYDLIATMASSNPDYFNASAAVAPTPVTDETSGITVTAPGLYGITVTESETTVPSLEGKDYVVYNIALTDANGASYTGEATVTIPVPENWTNVLGGVLESAAGWEVLGIEGELADGYFTFTAPHFSDIVAYAADTETENTINVMVGATVEYPIEGGDYTADVTSASYDTSIATVTAEYKQVEGGTTKTLGSTVSMNSNGTYTGVISDGNGNYLVYTTNERSTSGTYEVTTTTDINEATVWTVTRTSSTAYAISYDGNRLTRNTSGTVYTSNDSTATWRYSTTDGFYYSASGTTKYLAYSNNSWSASTSGSKSYLYSVTESTTEPVNATVLTITGVAAGTTYVTVNGVTYTINVVTEDLTNAAKLPIQLWITNNMISVTDVTTATTGSFWPYGSGYPAYYVSVSADKAYGVNGVELSTLVPTGVSANGAETTSEDTTAKYVLWKGTVLDSNKPGLQVLWGDNMSYSGSDYTYVRYYNGAWAVSADRETWTIVTGKGSTSSYSSCTEQVIAYYVQRTEITDQVITDMVDQGDILSNVTTTHGNITSGQYVILDYAVNVNGTLTPDIFPVSGKTILLHCAGTGNDTGVAGEYRRLNAIKATETSVYEVYMITIKPTQDGSGTTFSTNVVPTNYAYNGTEYVIWAESEAAVPEGYATADQYTVGSYTYSVTYGGDPTIDELYIYNRQGMLVTYYVRGVQTEDSLTIEYVDDTTGDTFYTSSLPVKVEGEGTKDFTNSLLDANGDAYTVTGTTTLDDNTYYVVEYYGAKVYVRTDLTQIPDLHGVYTTGAYTQVKAEIDSSDSKVLIIHYTYDNSKRQANFVVDFGLPVTVNYSQLGLDDSDITDYAVSGGTYGTVVENIGGNSFTYTPNAILKGSDEVTVTVTFNDNTTRDFRVGFIPATTVYYEEGFATYTGSWTGTTSVNYTATQATQIAGKSSDEYGYDAAYAGTVNASNGTQATSTAKGDKAEFTFTGTGVDIYTNSTTSTGWLMIKVANSAGSTVKLLQVDTSLKVGTTDATNFQSGTGYNVPVASITGLDRGEYTVTITNAGTIKVDPETSKTTFVDGTVNLDGFRVYGTHRNESNDYYIADKEDNPIFIELRDQVLASLNAESSSSKKYAAQIAADTLSQVYSTTGATAGAVIISNANADYTDEQLIDLLDNGPKNEIYLRNGQSLVFTITTNREVQIGLKALNASTSYTINNGTAQTLNSSTDMFYTVLAQGAGDATNGTTITITNKGDGILAITKLKVCDDPNASLGALTAEDLVPALLSLGFKSEPEAAEEPAYTYAIAKLTIRVNRSVTTVTKLGVAGERATFTADEIKEAVAGLVGDGYTLVKQANRDITVAYGQSKTVTLAVTRHNPRGNFQFPGFPVFDGFGGFGR